MDNLGYYLFDVVLKKKEGNVILGVLSMAMLTAAFGNHFELPFEAIDSRAV